MMKRVLTCFLFLFLGTFLGFNVSFGQLDQMLNRTKDKTKQKVQQRVQRKVDRQIDQTLDDAENSIDGKDKKKKDKDKKKKDKKKDKDKDKKKKGDDEASDSGSDEMDSAEESADSEDESSDEPAKKTNSESGSDGSSGTTSNNSTSSPRNPSTAGNAGGNSGTNAGVSNGGLKKTGNSGNVATADPEGSAMGAFSSTSNSTFQSGEYLLFWDDQTQEEVGEFPSKWNLLGGSAENASFGGSNVIHLTGYNTEITPLLASEDFLPATFTVEFDAYFYNRKDEVYFINLKGAEDIKVTLNNAEMGRFNGFTKAGLNQAAWRHIGLAYNQGNLQLFIDRDRVLNIPNVPNAPSSFSITANNPGAASGQAAMIKNIRIAKGAGGMGANFLSEGKIVTRGIQFKPGQSDMLPGSMNTLKNVASLMKDNADSRFSVECHTDSRGNDALNKQLSEQRAEAVRNELKKLGISASRMETRGWGEAKPVDTNKTPEGRFNNNRVEFVQL